MKKLTILVLGLVLATMVYGGNADLTNTTPSHIFKVNNGSAVPYKGSRATPILVDQIPLDAINAIGYCWGIAYDWERDGLWVTQWNSAYNKMYCIQKTSPCTKIDSVTLGSGVPTYRLGIGYGGSNTMYMAAYDANVYAINMTNGTGSVWRAMPWSGCEGFDINLAGDAAYASDWSANQCAWAQPAHTGSWTTWSVNPYPSGMTGAFSATTQPTKMFMCDESGPPSNLFQYVVSGGVPTTTPESTWTLDAGMTGVSTADCAFDGHYVYVLDQSGPDRIWVYDVGISMNDTVTWDFETGLQGWTHTNGQAFPIAWAVEPYNLHTNGYSPNPGDSSMWIDSDAGGTVTCSDTAWSPWVIPNSHTHWFKWGFGFYYYSGSDFMTVGIRQRVGGVWQAPVQFRLYQGANYNAVWDSVDVSSYQSAELIQVYFYYYGYYDWYASFDNVKLNGTIWVASHDVRAVSVDAPATRIPPNVAQTPTATYKNVGNNTETFSVNFVIDSAGTIVYNQSATLNNFPANTDTTVAFLNWTPGAGDGFTYNIRAFTVMAGDANPANDTVYSTAMISSVSNWIQRTDMPDGVECHATAYDPVHDKVYVFGGYHGDNTFYNYNYQFDPTANTWTQMTVIPVVNDWIDASYVRGKFYIFGGYGNSTVHNYNYQYDVTGNSWSTGTVMPIARIAGGQVIYNDSLIYYLGGYNGSGPSNNVQVYNTYTNAWTTGTALPAADMMQGVAITGDTIWLVGGYSGTCYNNLYYGVINPTTNETITWNTGAALAVPVFNNGATQMIHNGVWHLYIVGGFENAATITAHAWDYNVSTGAWSALPDYPFTVTRNDILVSRQGHDEIYVAGGDNSAGWTQTPQCWMLQWNQGAEEKPNTTPKTNFGLAPLMNPVKGRITMAYTTPVAGNVSLKVYDGMGRLVKVLAQGVQPAGTKTVAWDAKDNAGRSLISGVYFIRLEANGQSASYKLVLVK